jgi:hypothetical protein
MSIHPCFLFISEALANRCFRYIPQFFCHEFETLNEFKTLSLLIADWIAFFSHYRSQMGLQVIAQEGLQMFS